jgi:hypothetical protein
VQKSNKEIKRNNERENKERVMREVREFVKENINIGSVEPTNLSLVRTIIDRMELKVKG